MMEELTKSARLLAQKSFRAFESIPKDLDLIEVNDEYRRFIVSQSELFREALSALNGDINFMAESMDAESNGATTSLEQEFDLVSNIEQAWHFCEVFLLNPTKHISIELARWLKTSSRQYPVELAIEKMKSVEQPELLKANPDDATSFDYWTMVYSMILQGNTLLACEALVLHSEFAQLLENSSSSHKTQHHSHAQPSVAHCQALFDTILSHPYIPLLNGEDIGDLSSQVQNTGMVAKFNDWQKKVQKLRESNNTLLLSIPQLDTILRILLGEVHAITAYTNNDWMAVTLGMLLFVYPPPLKRADLSQVFEEALSLVDFSALSDSDVEFTHTVREIMSGNVGPLLKSMYEQGSKYLAGKTIAATATSSSGSNSSMQVDAATAATADDDEEEQVASKTSQFSSHSAFSLVSLLSVSHLALLLVHGADMVDLTRRLDNTLSTGMIQNSAVEEPVSFIEKVFLETAVRMNEMEFTIEMVLGYLTMCPTQGRQYAATLLSRRHIATDARAIAVSDALFSIDFEAEALQVLYTRAQYWLNKSHPLYVNHDYVKAILAPHVDVANNVLKHEKSNNCVSTLSKAVHFLQIVGDVPFVNALLDRVLYRLMSAVSACEPLFAGLSMHPMAPVPADCVYRPDVPAKKAVRVFTQTEELSLISNLEYVLQEASDVLDTLNSKQLLAQYYASGVVLSPEDAGDVRAHALWADMLTNYASAVKIRLYESDSIPQMYAALCAVNRLVNDLELTPVRYYLHLLDLSVWFGVAITSLKKAQRFTDMIPAVDVVVKTVTSGTDQAVAVSQSYVTPKVEQYKLVAALARITTTSSVFDRLLAGCGANDTELQALRLALLGQLTNSLVQDKADEEASQAFVKKMAGPGEVRMDLRTRVPVMFENDVASDLPPRGNDSFAYYYVGDRGGSRAAKDRRE